MTSVKVWDPFVRIFHWTTVFIFFANFTIFDDDSTAHTYAGYVLLGLLLCRLIWGLVGTRHARFRTFWPRVSAIWHHTSGYFSDRAETYLSHNPLGALMVVNLMATLLLICVTGIMLADGGFAQAEIVKDTHELLANYAMVCVGLHVLGVIIETRRSKVSLLRAMITGWKTIPKGPRDAL